MGRGWSSYVPGSTLASGWAAQQALEAQGALLSIKQRVAIEQMNNSLTELRQPVTSAREAFAAATFSDPPDSANLNAKAEILANAELALANARAEAFAKIQNSDEKLTLSQAQKLTEQEAQGFRGGRGGRGGFGGFGSGPGSPGGGVLEAEVLAGADFSPKLPVQVRTPREEVATFTLPPGYHLTPVLWDPHIQEPTQIAFDGNGRLFVLEMRSYMQDPADASVHLPISRISMHEDLNNDGVYDENDRHTVFVDGLVAPRYVMPLGLNRVVVLEFDQNDAYVYTDTDNDGVADKKEVFAAGVGQIGGNVEHQNSGLTWALDNRLYATSRARRLRWTPGGVIQEESGNPGGQWGITMDNYGKIFSQEGATGVPAYFQLPIHYGTFNPNSRLAGLAPGFNITWGPPTIGDMQGGMADIRLPDYSLRAGTAAAGNDIFRGDRLPKDMIGDYFYGETVARIVRRIRPVMTEGLTQLRNVYDHDEFIKSTDPLFRPVDMTTAPDGTLYITDMYRGIIQESAWSGPNTYLRAKIEEYSLDRIVGHGRIFRLTYDGISRDATKPRMGEETTAQLVAHLEHPNGWWRDTAQQNIVLRQDKAVVPALQNMAHSSPSQLGRIHALWTLEGLGALEASLVREELKNSDPKIRIQAARLSETLIKAGDTSLVDDVKELANDTDPEVVVQAMLTLGYVQRAKAVPFIQSAMAANKAVGVTEIGSLLVANGGMGARGGRGGPFGGMRGGPGGRGARGGRGGFPPPDDPDFP
jgi:glucose/arabinose dehydrogenase